jgi:hypothetical protein
LSLQDTQTTANGERHFRTGTFSHAAVLSNEGCSGNNCLAIYCAFFKKTKQAYQYLTSVRAGEFT